MSVTTGPPIEINGVHLAPSVPVVQVHAGAAIQLGSGSPLPINTVGTQPGNVLVAGSDGVYRPAPPAQQRGSVVHYLTADPGAVPAGVIEGDWVAVIAGTNAGTVYHAEET